MKKTIIILISILAGIYIALTILGGGGEYAAEKLLYKAAKINKEIAANPDVAPPKLLEQVENNLKKLLGKHPKTEAAKKANIMLVEFYIFHKRYNEALSMLDLIIKTYDKNTAVLSTAYFLKGRAYEKQDKWVKALKEYESVRDRYTNTELGVQMPIYIAKYYADKGRDADARQAYNDAILFYETMEKESHGKAMGYIASTLMLQAYINMADYERAGKVLEKTINKYMGRLTLLQLLPQVDNIIVKKLDRPDKAIEIYKSVKEKSRDEKLNKFLQQKIEVLSKLEKP